MRERSSFLRLQPLRARPSRPGWPWYTGDVARSMANSFEEEYRSEMKAVREAVVERLHEMEIKLIQAFDHYAELNLKAIAESKFPPAYPE